MLDINTKGEHFIVKCVSWQIGITLLLFSNEVE